jgi:hypothetical protein
MMKKKKNGKMKQSTGHILMVEPYEFYANPETMDTNVYQVEKEEESHEVILEKALAEFRDYRNMLVGHGVMVTTALGREGCPDMVFPNWASTYDHGWMILHPMYNENRRKERTSYIVKWLKKYYPHIMDWRRYEKEGLYLESTASIVSDHRNKFAYVGLSKRTSRELVEKWGGCMGYNVLVFETNSHKGIPVYHTDFLMYIGTKMAGICAECITDEGMRRQVLERLSETHEVVEFTMEQLRANCCNALEVIGKDEERMLTMSKAAYEALTVKQLDVMKKHYKTIITPDLTTLEKYGGGSARCMLMELF